MSKDIFEFRMKGRDEDDIGHCWEGMVDLREISIEKIGDKVNHILFKMDGANNKTKAREQIQFHMSPYTFENICTAINAIMPEYKKLEVNK